MNTFVPSELDARRWENLDPLYQALLDRPLKCEGCLEQLLLDRSELDAALAAVSAKYAGLQRRDPARCPAVLGGQLDATTSE